MKARKQGQLAEQGQKGNTNDNVTIKQRDFDQNSNPDSNSSHHQASPTMLTTTRGGEQQQPQEQKEG
jgi:hypothetical protein